MERTNTKRQKVTDVNQNMDRLSALPDDLVCRILLFLPTKLSVSTSVLSRRWRFMWAHVPNLDFDCKSHNKRHNFGLSDVICRVMFLYKVQNMNTFYLSYKDACGDFQLETCITAAILRNVKNFNIILGKQNKLPHSIFTCKTLVTLRLHYCREIPTFCDVYLPALKQLFLFMVKYESDKSLEHLLSGCPVLEDLIVKRIAVDPLVSCYISSPTLNRLILDSVFHNNGSYTETYKVKIDTPALRHLKVKDIISEDISSESLTSLILAVVSLRNDFPVDGDVVYSHSVLNFVGKLCNVKNLRLSTGRMEVSDSTFSALTVKFHNLTELVLDADSRFISNFLENADSLEVLTINNNLKYWIEPPEVPTCLSSHLRYARIENFECTEQEFKMVKYLLGNAKVLKMITIVCSCLNGIDLKARFDALQRISMFERAAACQLDFH